jgi:beta-fructofuranosidase
MFFAPQVYEPDDWRDPFIFWNDESSEYGMLLAARKPDGPNRHRGCVALATSPDLEMWTVREPFWLPYLYFTHECPDLFQMGGWWYLVYSTFSERCVTHYRMSRSLAGPWIAPSNDTFDGRAFYAAKTASDGERRFIFGWLPTRVDEKDEGNWQWGGNLVTHEIHQETDGMLSVRPPETVYSAFSQTMPLSPRPILGDWSIGQDRFSSESVGRFSAISLGTLPQTCLIEAEITLEPGTVSTGLVLRAGDNLDYYYQLRLEPGNDRVVFDRWPRPGDQPFMLERPLKYGQSTRLKVLIDKTCIVAYVNDEVALSCRMYNHRSGDWGLFVTEGDAIFNHISLRLP